MNRIAARCIFLAFFLLLPQYGPPHFGMAAQLFCKDSSGSPTAQSCATTPDFPPYPGDMITYETTTTNTGDLTINVNSMGAVHVRKWLGASVLASGDLPSGSYVVLTYDGTYWEIPAIGNAPSNPLDPTFFNDVDEFQAMAGTYSSGSLGGTEWTTNSGAFGTIQGIPGPSQTGAFEFLSTTTGSDNELRAVDPNGSFYGAYGNVSAYTNWTAEWTVELHQTASETLRFGLGDGINAATAGALYIRYDTSAADTTFHAVCSVNGTGITVNTNTAISPTAAHVYRFGIQSTTTGTVAMYIYDNGSLVYGPTTICSSTNVPTTNLGRWAAINNISSVVEVDFDRYVWRRTGVTGR
jgi:hypothetical protein